MRIFRHTDMKRCVVFTVAMMMLLAAAQSNAFTRRRPVSDPLASPGDGLQTEVLQRIPDVLVSFDQTEHVEYALVVEKKTQQAIFYAYNGNYREIRRMPVSTGEASGPKTASGDRKSPEGVYFFTKEFLKKYLSPIYGTRAFPLDYPNLVDKMAQRGGYAIWLHGTNRPIRPNDSNGCIVLENSDIDTLAKYIKLNRTPIIIADSLSYVDVAAQKIRRQAVMNFIWKWKESSQKDRYSDFSGYYDPLYGADADRKARFEVKKKIFNLHPSLFVEFRRVSVFKQGALYVALFDEMLRYSGSIQRVGTRKLFLTEQEGRFVIVGDGYQPQGLFANEDPFVTAFEDLKKKLATEHKIAYRKAQ